MRMPCQRPKQAVEDTPELWVSAWALPELIEAATRAGETRLAVEALEPLAEATSAGGTDWGLGVHARCRALLSEGEEAEGCYREAIDQAEPYTASSRPRSGASALRRVAATRGSTA